MVNFAPFTQPYLLFIVIMHILKDCKPDSLNAMLEAVLSVILEV